MGKNFKTNNQEVKDKDSKEVKQEHHKELNQNKTEPKDKDFLDSPSKKAKQEEHKKPKQDKKSKTELKQHTIITPAPYITLFPRNIDFTTVINQPCLPPHLLTQYLRQQWFRSAIFEVPPSNLSRYLQFYALKQQDDFFQRIF